MYKCKNCGAEFEGKFCPECGTKRDEARTCPNCGRELNSGWRFCYNCGESLPCEDALETTPIVSAMENAHKSKQAPEARPTPIAEKDKKLFLSDGALFKIHTVLKYLPMAFFVLYSLLMFAFFAADVAYFESDSGYFGTVSESLGTVYADITDSISDIKGCVVALYIFFVISLLLSVVMVLGLFVKSLKNKSVRGIALNDLFVYISFALYFVFFVIAIAMMVTVSSFADGLDEICVGGAPKLILSFAIIFGVFGAAAKIGDRMICKKCPKTGDAKKHASDISSDEQPRAHCATETVRQRSARDAFYGGSPEISEADENKSDTVGKANVDKSCVCFRGKPVFRRITAYVKLSRALLGLGIAALVTSFFFFVFVYIAIKSHGISRNTVYFVGLGLFVLYLVLGMLCTLPPVRWWATSEIRRLPPNLERKTRREKTKIIGLFIASTAIMAFVVLQLLYGVIVDNNFAVVTILYISLLIFAFNIIGIIACTVCKSRKKRLALHFFGVEKPNEVTPEIVCFDLEKEKAFAADYKRDKSIVALYSNNAGSRRIGVIRSTVIGLIFIGIVVCFSIFFVVFSPFRVGLVSRVTGLRMREVKMLFGDPDAVNSNDVYEYFDGDYLSIYNRAKKLNDQLTQAANDGDYSRMQTLSRQLEQLKSEASKIVYKKLSIYSSGKIIELNTCARGDGIVLPKTPTSTSLMCDSVFMGALPENTMISYVSSYTDGSYKRGVVSASAVTVSDMDDGDILTVKWSDDWAMYTAAVRNTNSVYRHDNGVNYSVVYDKKTDRVTMTVSGEVYSLSAVYQSVFSEYASLVTDLELNLDVEVSNESLDLSKFGSLEHIYIKENSSYVDMNISQCNKLIGIWAEDKEIPDEWYLSAGVIDYIHFGDEWELVDGVPCEINERTYINGTYVCDDGISIKFGADGRFELVEKGYNQPTKGKYIIIGDKLRMIDAYGYYIGTMYDNKIVIHGKNQDFVYLPVTIGDTLGGILVDAEELKDTTWCGEIVESDETVKTISLTFNMFGNYILQMFVGQKPASTATGKYSINGSNIILVNGSKTMVCIVTEEGIILDLDDWNHIILEKQ